MEMRKEITLINFYDYALAASATLKEKDTDVGNLTHFALGVLTEFFELVEGIDKGDKVNISEECGDSIWYIANHALLEFSDDPRLFKELTEIFWEPKNTFALPHDELVFYKKYLREYGDIIKLYFLTGKKVDGYNHIIKRLFKDLCKSLASIQLFNGISPTQTLHNNINKLYDRYGDKFDDYLCFNRDLIKEYKTLSENING